MEKFAVDLDKVLDEFELKEDQEEQAAAILEKKFHHVHQKAKEKPLSPVTEKYRTPDEFIVCTSAQPDPNDECPKVAVVEVQEENHQHEVVTEEDIEPLIELTTESSDTGTVRTNSEVVNSTANSVAKNGADSVVAGFVADSVADFGVDSVTDFGANSVEENGADNIAENGTDNIADNGADSVADCVASAVSFGDHEPTENELKLFLEEFVAEQSPQAEDISPPSTLSMVTATSSLDLVVTETNNGGPPRCLNDPDVLEGRETRKHEHETENSASSSLSETTAEQKRDEMENELEEDSESISSAETDELQPTEPNLSESLSQLVHDSPSASEGLGMLDSETAKPCRPTWLHLPGKISMPAQSENMDTDEPSTDSDDDDEQMDNAVIGPPGATPANPKPPSDISQLPTYQLGDGDSASESSNMLSALTEEERFLGKIPPFWVPDSDAPQCMQCSIRFTVIKRRHHCRACGKVLCSQCCNAKAKLPYMATDASSSGKDARVCQPCLTILNKVEQMEQMASCNGSNETVTTVRGRPARSPNPNNPMEYCSTIPPLQQAQASLNQPPPAVMVPVGVLKREGSTSSSRGRGEPKQVMFSDGIRPGGDLAEELEVEQNTIASLSRSSGDSHISTRQEANSSMPGTSALHRLLFLRGKGDKNAGGKPIKSSAQPPGQDDSLSSSLSGSARRRFKYTPLARSGSAVFLGDGEVLPPVVSTEGAKGEYQFDQHGDKLWERFTDESALPVSFAVNRNLYVLVKVLDLECCANRTCWCFTSKGLSAVGQDEVVIVLECLPEEKLPPKDIFTHFHTLFLEASRGSTVSDLGHTLFTGPFLGSRNHGGFLYVRPTFQCLHKLVLPPAPFLVGVLLQKWETPWAKVFPLRLMLRLGAEFRYYPCPLMSVRERRPLYCEIGHTIMNLLADLRNFTYYLPTVRGMEIRMEDKRTTLLLPRNRYDQVVAALNNSNDHVLALGASFGTVADSHLVCIQAEDGSYQTQAINIQNKPRKVTGASFVVFNGALKTSSGLTAKSSIVEDGLMVQIPSTTMQALRTALREMRDFDVPCGPSDASQPDEAVVVRWGEEDKNFNIGVKSAVDGLELDGIPSIRVHSGTDYAGETRFVRWTEVFLLQTEETRNRGASAVGDPVDLSRVADSIARAACIALVPHLDVLREAAEGHVAIRVNIDPDNVSYEAGCGGHRLAAKYMNSLDTELIPVIHKAASSVMSAGLQSRNSGNRLVLELIFHILDL